MELQPLGVLELGREGLLELPGRIEARDLVFVLVGDQLGVVARHRLGQHRRARKHPAFGLAHAIDELAVAPRGPPVLEANEVLLAPGDEIIERFRHRRGEAHSGRLGDPREVGSGATAPREGRLVGLHGGSVQLDGPQQALAGQRNAALLPRVTEHERIGGNAVAHQRGGQGGGVELIDRLGTGGLRDATA